MKAIVYTEYGSPDVLQFKEVEKPVPKDDEVLVKVHAASLNNWDWDLVRGKPYLFRLISGLLKPKYNIIGADIAGRVEAIGGNITGFQVGDEVFGDLCESGWGGFAEYTCARENALALKPASMTFEQAAAIPQGGVMALQGIRDDGKVQSGHKVLINGAGGATGTFAIQMGKHYGAEVSAVDHASKFDLMRSIGADHVIDYTQEDFTQNGKQYDLIIDVVANRSIFDYRRALSPEGKFFMVGGTISSIFQVMILGPMISKKRGKKLGVLMHKPNKDLSYIIALFEAGKVIPVIDKCYPLSEVPEAIQRLGEGKSMGKIIITM
ncbi:NAD(P)-dependent alcohol dehydrogenase [Bacteroidota bacterium]